KSFIADKDVDGVGWVYTVSAHSLLEDVFTSVSLKRALERDPDAEAAHHPYVVGRCALAGPADIDAAVDAAAQAGPVWAATPLRTRLDLGPMLRDRLLRHREELLDLLVSEAHPRRLARWEFSCLLQVFSKENCSWYERQMHAEIRHGRRHLIVRRLPDG